MHLTTSFITLVAVLGTLCAAFPFTGFRDVITDIENLRQSAANLGNHVHNMDMLSMLQDKKAIIDGLDRIAKDATAAKSFTSPEASEVLTSAHRLSQEINQLSKTVIQDKDKIPQMLHSTVAGDLRTISSHAKVAGEAITNDCPAEKKLEASRIYAEIAGALNDAIKAFSS